MPMAEAVLAIFMMALFSVNITESSKLSQDIQQAEKTGKNSPQVIDLMSIDPSRNRYRLYRIVRRGTVVSTLHGRKAPNESPYLKRAKAPRKFDCEDEAFDYIESLIRNKVNRRRDPYAVVDSSEMVR